MARKPKPKPHPYVKMRPQPDGSVRPRFEPGPAQRKLGYEACDLKDEKGGWLTYEKACLWAKAKRDEIAEAIKAGTKPKAPRAAKGTTVEDLLTDFLAAMKRKIGDGSKTGQPAEGVTPGARKKPKSTISEAAFDSYAMAARAVIFKPETRAEAKARRDREKAARMLGLRPPLREKEEFATRPVAAIGAPELRDFFEYAGEARGHHMAIAMIGVISAAFTWGKESSKWRLKDNPRIGMQFERPHGRVMLIPLDQFTQIVAAADLIGYSSIGDSWFIGLFTGQRQTDRRQLQDKGLVDGRRVFQQSKTGVLLHIKEAPQLAERLDSARARGSAVRLKFGTRQNTIVVDERTGLPYDKTTYRHRVTEARRAAVHGVILLDGKAVIADPEKLGADFMTRLHNQITWLLQPMPACADKRDQDLRDTFVILTYRAMVKAGNVNLKAICDVSGHSYSSVETIVKHYLGRDPSLADSAIDTLSDFVTKEMAG